MGSPPRRRGGLPISYVRSEAIEDPSRSRTARASCKMEPNSKLRRRAMAQDQPPSDETPEFTPERWELAIEDAAELVALMLERGQSLTEAIRDLSKQRPLLMASILAVGVGAIGGALFASGRRRNQSNIVAEASAVAEAASHRLTHQTDNLRTLGRGWI